MSDAERAAKGQRPRDRSVRPELPADVRAAYLARAARLEKASDALTRKALAAYRAVKSPKLDPKARQEFLSVGAKILEQALRIRLRLGRTKAPADGEQATPDSLAAFRQRRRA